jgi:hypothetical protein
VWGARPPLGAPFLYVGQDGVPDRFRETWRAIDEGPTERFVVRYQGIPLRTVTVTPFAVFAGEARAR